MTSEAMTETERARAQLASTLDAVREKLDVSARLHQARERVSRSRTATGRSPLRIITLMTGLAAATGAAILTTIGLATIGTTHPSQRNGRSLR